MRTKIEKLEKRRRRMVRTREQLVALGQIAFAATVELVVREIDLKIARLRAEDPK